jgi:hypothetical protein
MLWGKQNRESVYFKHATADSLRRGLGDEFYSYYRFTFVRNPWDWIVSNYVFNRGLHNPYVKETTYDVAGRVPDWAEDMPFSEWLRWWIKNFRPSQTMMITDDNGACLVDDIFRFESLSLEYRKLKSKIKVWNPRVRIPHLKRSRTGDNCVKYYDAESVRLVQKHFAQDIDMLGYPSEPQDLGTESS